MKQNCIKLLRKCVLLFSICFMLVPDMQAQDPHFSQFYANPLYLNPALAGSVICPRVTANYRNQWPSLPGNYVTYNAAYDQYFPGISGGIGVLATSDRIGSGAILSNSFSAMYSFKMDVTRDFSIRAALQAGITNRRLDFDNLIFGDQIDPILGYIRPSEVQWTGRENKTFLDFSTGFMGYSDNFYFGFAVHHVTQPDEGFINVAKLPFKFTGHAGTVINLREPGRGGRSKTDPTLSPNILYMQQLNFHELNYGFYFNLYPFVAGMWFRQNFENPDALIFLLGMEYNSFKFAYSYDLTVSKLANSTGGAHELSLGYVFNCPQKKTKIRPILCPVF